MKDLEKQVNQTGKAIKPNTLTKIDEFKLSREINLELGGIKVRGVSFGTCLDYDDPKKGRGIGYDFITAKRDEESRLNLVLADATGSDGSLVVQPEHLAIKKMVDAITSWRNIPASIEVVPNSFAGENSYLQNHIGGTPFSGMVEVVSIKDSGSGAYEVVALGRGDVTALALLPDETGRFSTESVRFLHFNPKADRSRDTFGARERGDTKPSPPSPDLLPERSVIVMFSDGGAEALFSEFLLESIEWEWNPIIEDHPQELIRDLFASEFLNSEQEQRKAMVKALSPLIDLINEKGTEDAIDKIMSAIKDFSLVIPDDVSLMFAELK